MATRALAVFYAALSAGALAASGVGLAEPGLVGVWGVNTGWTLAGLAAFISMAAAARRVGRNRVGWAWRLWASGAGLWLLGALAGDALTLAGVRGGLTVTVLWSLFAVFSIAGLAYRSVPGFFSFQLSLLDALPVVLAVTAVSVASGTLPGGDSLFVPAILAAALYAYLGLVGLQILAWLAAQALNMWILVAGFALTATAGLAGSGSGQTVAAVHGRWSDPLWTLGLIIVGFAGLRRALSPASYTRLVPVEREHGARSLPAAGAIIGLMFTAVLTPGRQNLYLWLALAGFISFACRTYFVRRANSHTRDQLARQTLLDPLTELFNRRGLDRALSSEIDRSKRDGSTLHALLIDVDDLKAVNDMLGHAVGDVVLQEVGKAVAASSRSTDHAARIGGDEFVALLPNTQSADAICIAERMRLAIAGLVLSSDVLTMPVTASFAIVQVSEEVSAIDELLRDAHPILRKSKQAGKDRVSYVSSSSVAARVASG